MVMSVGSVLARPLSRPVAAQELRDRRWTLSLFGLAFGLGAFALYVQLVRMPPEFLGPAQEQLRRLQVIVAGTEGSPWQYRPLSAYLLLAILSEVAPANFTAVLILCRLAINVAVFAIAGDFYRSLGLSRRAAVLGMGLLVWAMAFATQSSGLSFDTYLDLLAYLLAGLLIMRGHLYWLIPLTLLAAFNRETSGFIPLLPLALLGLPGATRDRRGLLLTVGLASVVYVTVFVLLRTVIYPGPREVIGPYGIPPGLQLLDYNLHLPTTGENLLLTFNVLPLLAIVSLRSAPMLLKRWFWLVVPLWFVIHLIGSVISETRLLLVPLALVVVPLALFGVSD